MIIFILLLGLGLRLISLNQSLWLDEATSVSTIHMSLSQFFGKFIVGDFHPPLYYLTLRVWSIFFGTTEIGLRSLSILFGVLTIYFVYLIGKELINKETGIVGSIFVATSGLSIYYSQEARMYAMSTFLVTFAMFSFVKILKTDRVEYWMSFAITLGLVGATDYLPLLILPVFFVIGILGKKNINWFKKLITSHIILGVLAALWLPIFLKQLHSGLSVANGSPAWVNVLGTFSVKNILLIPVKFGIGRISFDNKFVYAAVVLTAIAIFAYLFYKARRDTLIWMWLILPTTMALLISIKIPVLNYFRFLFVLPAFYLIAATGANALKNKFRVILVVLVLALNLTTSFIYLSNVKFQREDWRDFAKFVGNSPVLFAANSQKESFLYYDAHANIINLKQAKDYKEVFLIRYSQEIVDPADSTRENLENLGYHKLQEYDFNGVVVWKYARSN
ncbi:MAG TPA: glycosyltransferase family 39 protein [Patescibacteria group bacterium]|nr:glycosyltransferase family 39 protein [Patescibacteria group bacterium]